MSKNLKRRIWTIEIHLTQNLAVRALITLKCTTLKNPKCRWMASLPNLAWERLADQNFVKCLTSLRPWTQRRYLSVAYHIADGPINPYNYAAGIVLDIQSHYSEKQYTFKLSEGNDVVQKSMTAVEVKAIRSYKSCNSQGKVISNDTFEAGKAWVSIHQSLVQAAVERKVWCRH